MMAMVAVMALVGSAVCRLSLIGLAAAFVRFAAIYAALPPSGQASYLNSKSDPGRTKKMGARPDGSPADVGLPDSMSGAVREAIDRLFELAKIHEGTAKGGQYKRAAEELKNALEMGRIWAGEFIKPPKKSGAKAKKGMPAWTAPDGWYTPPPAGADVLPPRPIELPVPANHLVLNSGYFGAADGEGQRPYDYGVDGLAAILYHEWLHMRNALIPWGAEFPSTEWGTYHFYRIGLRRHQLMFIRSEGIFEDLNAASEGVKDVEEISEEAKRNCERLWKILAALGY
ncbi:MAG: hypothetical protein CSA62_07705 [Planctomycetota bacterium]|nr:MAG: hypothetical protein CSA62_07705 [Planctomycetota bacterium]